MTNTENKNIDPIEFLTLYQKIDKLKPKTFEYISGLIDGISAGFDIAVNQQEQKGAWECKDNNRSLT